MLRVCCWGGCEDFAVSLCNIGFVYVARAIFYFFNIRRSVVYLIRGFFLPRVCSGVLYFVGHK